MRLVYLANVRLPTEKAHGVQIMQMCAAFASNGHEVTLIVPRRKNAIEATPWEYYGLEPSFKIVEVPILDFIPFDRWLGNAALWLTTLWFAFKARGAIAAARPDAVYSRDAILAPLAPKGTPFIFEAHDFPTKPWLYRRLWKRCARIVTVTDGLKRALMAAGMPASKLLVAHDAVDPRKFQAPESRAEARRALGLPAEGFIAVYTGHLYPYKGADDLLEACAHLRPASRVVFVGGHPEEVARLRARAAALGLANAVFVGQVPHARVPLYLRAADAAVLPTRDADRHASEFLSPLKLFEYLAAGKAIVATDLPSVREVLDARTAVFVPSQDPRALSDALNALADVPAEVERLSRAAEAMAGEHTWSGRAERVFLGIAEPWPLLTWFRKYRTELLCALLAFVLRAAYVMFFSQVKVDGGDGVYYLGIADYIRGVRDAIPYGAPTFYPILYPSLLAAVRSVFGEDLIWIRLVQSALSSATVFLMVLMARRWIGIRASIAAGLVAALYPPMILECGVIYTETTYAFLLTAAVAASLYAVETRRARTALAAGLAFVLTGLTRELGFYQAVLYAGWMAFARRSWKLTVLILLPTLVALGCVGLRNASIARQNSLTSQPLVSKGYETMLIEPTLAHNLFAPERWQLYLQGAILYWRLPFRISDLGSGEPLPGHDGGEVVSHLDPSTLFASQPVFQLATKGLLVFLHWLILALAVFGFFRGGLSKETKIAFALAIIFAFATIMIEGLHRTQAFQGLEPLARYRFPTEPILLLLAVAGAASLTRGKRPNT